MMSLFTFTITTALLIGALGVCCFVFQNKNNELSTVLRSPKVTILFLGISLFWFLYRHVQSLGDADFGEYKVTIGLIAVIDLEGWHLYLCNKFFPDNLSVLIAH